jgi:Pentapeptide repeats (8 copies)/Pentapeptide repeats (9 copies)
MTDRANERPAETSDEFQSLAALRVAHLDLMRSRPQDKKLGGALSVAKIRQSLDRMRTAGAYISDEDERQKAQSILDYWNAELVSSLDTFETDLTPALLAPFDEQRGGSTQLPHQAEAELKQRREASRDQIRFAAAARLWRDSGKKHGYLLFGEAIAQAAKFRDLDPDIADLVGASEEARNSRRNRWLTIVLVVVGLYSFQFFGLPVLSNWAIVKIIKNPKGDERTKKYTLWMLRWIQPWMPPFDLSGRDVRLEGINLAGIKFYSANFSQASFANVNFSEADLRNASFSESQISKGSRFNNTDLSLAQFSDATIEATSFAGAELYRTAFDRACLIDVAFSGADLKSTSFWSATLDAPSRGHFANTAWWFADGWTSPQIMELVKLDQSKLKDNRFLNGEYREKDRELVRESGAGTYDRANALNVLAWTLVTWGVDITRTNAASDKPARSCDKVMQLTDVPDDALDAAEQAICILKQLSESGNAQAKEVLPNLQDTWAYVLMQIPGRMAEAAAAYQQDILPTVSTGETLFRSAVAEYALGHQDKATAQLKESMDKQYLPTHELQHLKNYITGPLRAEVYGFIDKFRPVPPRPLSCPATTTESH